MLNLLGATFFEQYGLMIILVVLVGVMFVYYYFKSKKNAEFEQELKSQLVVGANVKTTAGVYGKIIAIRETTDGTVATLELVQGVMDIDMRAIYMVDSKRDFTEEELRELEQGVNAPVEQPVEEVKEEPKQEEVVEEKPKRARKTKKKDE